MRATFKYLLVLLFDYVTHGSATFTSPLNIDTDDTARITVCDFTRTEPDPGGETTALCGYMGGSCSIAVYRNQSEADVQKVVGCDCLQKVLPYVDQAAFTAGGE